MKTFRPMIFLAVILMVVGLACSSVSSGGDTPAQPQEPVQQATNPPTTAPEPTAVPPTEVPPPTDTPEPEAKDFFVEEFEGDYNADNWQYFTMGSGTDSDLVIELEDDHLLFDLGDEDLYVYYVYSPFIYEDVTVKLNAENRGRNNNNVSLVCRMAEDGKDWYEFSVESGGVWYLYAVDDSYHIIDNGGTNALKQGKEVNEYQMDCIGDEITLWVNGTKVKTVKDTRYGLNEGLVGFNISSLNVLPITVEVNWFEIAQP